ncbi:hypothetical protein PVL29_016883 [Vitis rotundifolia]|uniref:Transposase-associated domain-containing protein n=1 Tax=Vitis rotundifolia TaxID=103349 RepID=A0AA38Z9A3_VITRO|nr:hypothetical protein PVL29_016883 [Vitis rotundifolia]
MDKSWMNLQNRLSNEYANGVKTFLQVAKNQVNQNGKIHCPCKHCQNAFWKSIYDIETYLYKCGIFTTYQRWIFHGEKVSADYNERKDMSGTNRLYHHETFTVNDDVDDDDEMIELLSDVCLESKTPTRLSSLLTIPYIIKSLYIIKSSYIIKSLYITF